jgi:hypothetical protein
MTDGKMTNGETKIKWKDLVNFKVAVKLKLPILLLVTLRFVWIDKITWNEMKEDEELKLLLNLG